MDHNKVSDYLLLIKQLSESQVLLLGYQSKVEGIVEMASDLDLRDYLGLKLDASLRALNDSVERAVFFTEYLINRLNRIATLLINKSDLIFDE